MRSSGLPIAIARESGPSGYALTGNPSRYRATSLPSSSTDPYLWVESSAIALPAIAAKRLGRRAGIVQQELEHRSQRIDVRARPYRRGVAASLFRSHVAGGSEDRAVGGVPCTRTPMLSSERSLCPPECRHSIPWPGPNP